MTPEELQKLKTDVEILKDFMTHFSYSDKYIFQKHLQFLDGKKITVGTNLGTRIGTSTTEKLGFFNATPVVQGGAISAPTGGATVDSQARSAIASMLTIIRNLGFIDPTP